MNQIHLRFGSKIVLPVIHVLIQDQVERNAALASECGARGVWLINHGANDLEDLLLTRAKLWKIDPTLWVGINCLGMSPSDVFKQSRGGCDGFWTDNAGVDDRGSVAAETADLALKELRVSGWHGLYFGGVAFKYQKEVANLAEVTASATQFVDVITTSGSGTGTPPDIQKMATMRNAAPDTAIAIASGITPENVQDYLPYADVFMVATGVSRSFYEFDKDRLSALINAVEH